MSPTEPTPVQPDPAAPAPATAAPPPAPTAPPIIRVNLLPQAYLEKAEVRRGQLVAVGAVAGAALIIGGLWVWARMDVNAAQEEVDAAQAANAQLVAEAAIYAAVPEAYRTVDEAQAEIAVAMAPDIRWSFVLNDLSLTIPEGVGLTAMNTTTTGLAPADDTDPLTPPQVVGAIAYTGEARTYPKVSEWLDSQGKQVIYTNVYLGSASKAESPESGQTVVTFNSTSDVTATALSRRFDSVPEAG